MAFLEGEKYYLELTATSEIDPTLVLNIKVHNSEGGTKDLDPITIRSGDRVKIEVGAYMIVGSKNAITVTIAGFSSKYTNKINNIRMVSMSIETNLDEFSNYAIFNSKEGVTVLGWLNGKNVESCASELAALKCLGKCKILYLKYSNFESFN